MEGECHPYACRCNLVHAVAFGSSSESLLDANANSKRVAIPNRCSFLLLDLSQGSIRFVP
jgi:hypothetical protein